MFKFKPWVYQNEAGEGEGAGGSAAEGMLEGGSEELGEGEFFLMEGVKGTGDIPDWYLSDKYTSVAEQAKAYPELSKKLGAFTGAPKDGYQLPEGFDAEDDLVKEVIKFGQDTNLHQDGFDKLMELAAAQAGAAEKVSKEIEMQKLGENASQRIKQAEVFLKNKAGDQYEAISELVTDANAVMLVEKFMQMMTPPKLPIDGVEVEGKPTWEEIQKEMFRKDEQGNLLRSVDRAHEVKIQRMMQEFGGDKPNNTVVG